MTRDYVRCGWSAPEAEQEDRSDESEADRGFHDRVLIPLAARFRAGPDLLILMDRAEAGLLAGITPATITLFRLALALSHGVLLVCMPRPSVVVLSGYYGSTTDSVHWLRGADEKPTSTGAN